MPDPIYFTVPTVKIHSDATEAGFVIINANEFNEAEHLLYEEPAAETPAA
jgi:hypothetical protein